MKALLKFNPLFKSIFLLLIIHTININHSFAIKGNTFTHDPSTITKSGNKYYTFSTGGGINITSSSDLISWKSSGSVFGSSFPSWIKTYCPNFTGNFWAPDVIFMNNRYYLYYSCYDPQLTNFAAIGVASSPTLDQSSADYKWTDHGMVVWSNNSNNKEVITIDPGLFKDNDNRVYMAYGTYAGKLAISEIDPSTGKVKTGDVRNIVAYKTEAAAMIRNGSYYYLISNHGSCCSGVNSGYYMTMGRSTTPKGPYLDANGTSLTSSYGTDLLRKSGRYIGPGHFGLLKENGIDFVSYHFYDGDNNGSPTLGIAKLEWNNDWPVISRNWLSEGSYAMTSKGSSKSLEVSGCSVSGTPAIVQNVSSTNNCQKWAFSPQGNGLYSITSALASGRAMEVASCGTGNGAKIQLGTWSNTACQKFLIERAGDGSYVLTPSNTARVVEIPGNSTSIGVQADINDYSGCACQKWDIDTPSSGPDIISGATYNIIAQHSNQYVDVRGRSTADGAIILQYTLTGATNQQWVVTEAGGGYYTFKAVHSNKNLDIAGGSTIDGALAVQQTVNTGSSSQQFQLIDAGDGYYQLKAKHSGKCLDVVDASIAPAAGIQQSTCDGGSNQNFKFTLISSSARLIQSSEANDLTAYPNPSAGAFQIKAKGAFTYVIKDHMGNARENGEGKDELMAGSNLGSGIYLLKVRTQQGAKQIKIIKN